MFRIVAPLAALPSLLCSIASATEWTSLPDLPVPRRDAASVLLDGRLFVVGGRTIGDRLSRRVDAYDPQANLWMQNSPLPQAVAYAGITQHNGRLWLAGGQVKDTVAPNVWVFDVARNHWNPGPPLPEARAGGGLVCIGDRLHYMGGFGPDLRTDHEDHWTLDLHHETADQQWRQVAPLPVPRNRFGTAVLEGQLHVLGGQIGVGETARDQTLSHSYDPSTDSWSTEYALPSPHSRVSGGTFAFEGRIFLIGGRTREGRRRRRISRHLLARTPDGLWQDTGVLPSRIEAPAAGIVDRQMIVAGGSKNGRDPLAAAWKRPIAELLRKTMSIERKTKVHRLSTEHRSIFDAFVYVNRIPDRADGKENAQDVAGRIFGRLANQEGRILLKLPPGMDGDVYNGFKTFLRSDGPKSVGNCVSCHSLPDFTDLQSHTEPDGRIVPTPSLRNRHFTVEQLADRISQKLSWSQDVTREHPYSKIRLTRTEIRQLVRFLQTLADVSDNEFRKLILDAELLDTSARLQ